MTMHSPQEGCCFLTDASYSGKLRDLWHYRGTKQYDFDDIMLLKVGRHLRPRPNMKLIIARDAGGSQFLGGYRRCFSHLLSVSHSGPLALLDSEDCDDNIALAARLTARIGQGRGTVSVRLDIVYRDSGQRQLEVRPLPAEQLPKDWYL